MSSGTVDSISTVVLPCRSYMKNVGRNSGFARNLLY